MRSRIAHTAIFELRLYILVSKHLYAYHIQTNLSNLNE